MLPVELPVAIRADDQQPLLRREAHDVAQHRDRAAVSPVEVVEHQHERRPHRRGEEELRDGVEQPEALLVRLQRRRRVDVRQPLPQGRHEARDRRRVSG